MISIVVDIAYRNPRVYPASTAILSKLFTFLKPKRQKTVVKRIRERFSQIPNTGHMEVWLQRITYPFAPEIDFNEPLCKLVCKKKARIWNNDWISYKKLLKAINAKNIVNRKELEQMPRVVAVDEIDLFKSQYY